VGHAVHLRGQHCNAKGLLRTVACVRYSSEATGGAHCTFLGPACSSPSAAERQPPPGGRRPSRDDLAPPEPAHALRPRARPACCLCEPSRWCWASVERARRYPAHVYFHRRLVSLIAGSRPRGAEVGMVALGMWRSRALGDAARCVRWCRARHSGRIGRRGVPPELCAARLQRCVNRYLTCVVQLTASAQPAFSHDRRWRRGSESHDPAPRLASRLKGSRAVSGPSARKVAVHAALQRRAAHELAAERRGADAPRVLGPAPAHAAALWHPSARERPPCLAATMRLRAPPAVDRRDERTKPSWESTHGAWSRRAPLNTSPNTRQRSHRPSKRCRSRAAARR